MRFWAAVCLTAIVGCVNRADYGLKASLLASPQILPANGVSYATVSINVRSNGVSLPAGVQLTLNSTEPNALITQFVMTPDPNGFYNAQLRSAIAGTQTLTATVSDGSRSIVLPATATVTFNPVAVLPGAPSPQTSWLAASPNVVADDGQATTLLTLHVLDGNGIPVPDVPVTFSSSGTNDTFSGGAGFTNLNGIATTTLASTTAETKTVIAQTPNMAVSTQVTFSPLGASTLFSSLQANPNSLTADGVTTTTLTFTVLNAEGMPLEGAPVSWSATGFNNTLMPGALVTDGNGVATATLASTTAQMETITATTGSMQVSQRVTFVSGPINGARCTFVANPNLVTANNTSASTLTFTALDSFGNPVANAPVSLSITGSNNTMSPLSGTTNSAGVFTSTLASGKAETKTVTATSGSIALNQNVTFLAGQPSSTVSTLAANPTSLTADGVSTATLTVTLEDAQGNPAPGQAVTFSSGGTNNTFAQAIGTTDAAGAYTTTLSSTTAEDKIVIASFAGGSVSADVTFVSGAASSSMTTLTASPSTVVANGSNATLLTVTVRDVFGNPVPLQAVTLSSTGSNNIINPASGTTDDMGTFSATLASITAEVKSVIATAGGASATATVTFVAGPPNGTNTTFSANPTSLTADGSSQSTLTVTVNDINGNPVANQSVTIASTGTNNTVAMPSGSTNASGAFSTTIASTKAEAKSITATVGAVVETAAVTFVAGAPSSSTMMVAASPNAVAANGTSATTLTVTVLDAQGNPVANQSVLLSSTGSNNTFANPTGTTNSTGAYSTTLVSTTAEVKTVTATAGAASATTTVTFTAGTPASANSTLSANPTSVTADGTSTTQLTFVVKDAFGNGVPHQAVTFSSTGSNNTFSPLSGNTDSTGTFVATLASTKAEAKTVTSAAGVATASTTVTFVAGVVSSTTTRLVANPNTVAADGSSAITLVTTALDAQGNPVAAQSVAMSASGSTNTFAAPTGSTNTSGTFTTTLTSTTAQTETVTALVAGTISANTNVTFTAPVVSPTNSTIVASPNSLIADGTTTTTITVTVLNSVGSPVIGASVAMSASGANNTFSSASGVTDNSGVFTTTLASTQSGAKTVTATVDGTALNTTVTFLAGTPSSTTSTLVANPNRVTADGTSTSTLAVVVLDINGNPEPNQTVALALSGGNNTLTPASGNTDATGTFTATLASTLAQTETVTATINGTFTETATVTFVPGTVSGVTTTLVASPNSTTANGTSTIAFTATVKDVQGNPVPSQSVVLSSTGSNNTFTPVTGSTNSSGVFTATMTSTKAEWKHVTATLGTVNENANVLFIAGPVSGTTSTLVVNPASVTANGNTTNITMTVLDGQGNPVANQSVTLSGSGTANTFTPATGSTNPNGVFTATLSSTVAQAETITAAVGSVNLTAAMTFTAGAPSSGTSSLSASPTTLVADGVTTTTLTVTVHDAQGNPVPSQPVSLSSNGASNTITPISGTTGVAGTFTATFASTKAQVKLVTATIGTVTETASVTFTAGAPSGTTTTFAANPTTVTADGASTSTLTVTVRDVYGNPVPNQGVTFSSSGSNNTFSPLSGSTNPNGVFTATLASTTAETKTVTAAVGSLAPTATVVFTAGTPASTTSSVSAVPGLVSADGSSTTTVTVTVLDAHGNPVANQAVSVGANGSSNIWGATSGSTNTSGVWSTTLASTLAQTETITATIGSVTETTSVTFAVGAPSNTTSTFTATPTSLTADGVAKSTLQITVKDGTGNPVSAQAVTFSASGTGYTLSGSTCSTNASGLCSVTLASTVAQTVTVTATFSGLTQTAAVTFVPGAPNSTTSSLTANPTSLPDDGASTSTLQVTVDDAHGNPITAQAVTFSSNGSGVTFSATTCSTNTSGVCSITVKSAVAQAITVTAAYAGATSTAAVTFTAGGPSTTASSLTASPTSLPDDGVTTSTLQVSVEDATANPLNGQAVTFSSTGSGVTFSATTCSTNASGLCSVTIKSAVAQTVTVTATFATLNKTAAVTFTTGAANTGTSTLGASPNTVTDDGVSISTLQVTVNDGTSNPVSGQAVTFSSTGTGYVFSSTTCTTIAAGTCSVTLKSTMSGTVTVTAAFAGHTETASVAFVPGAANNATSFLAASPNTLTDDGAATSTVQISVADVTSNPVSGQAVTFSSNGTGTTFSATTCTTNASGLCSVTLKATAAETVTVTANFAGLSKTANVVFVTGPAANATSSLSANPTSLTDNGVATSTLVISVNDATNNPVTGQAVTFAGSPSPGTTFSATTCATASNGQCSVTLRSTVAATVTVTATFAGFSKIANVTFVTGVASNANSTLTATPSSVPDDGITTSSLQITVEDATGNAVNNQAVTFASSGGVSTPLSAATCNTNASGVCSVTIKSAVAQTTTITATFAGLTKSTPVTFLLGNPNSSTSSLVASPTSLADNGVATTTLLVTVEDPTNNAVNGEAVTFTSTGSGYAFSATTCTTAGAGQCSVTLKSTVAQTVTVTASFASVTETAAVTFVTGVAASSTSSLTASPNSLADDGVATSTIQISVSDLTGNPVMGQAVTFGSNSTGSSFSATTCITNTSGLCSVTLKDTTAQTVTVTANFAGLSKTTNVLFVTGPVANATSSLSASPTSLADDGVAMSALLITVNDATNNPVAGQAVTFAGTPSTGTTFSASTCATGSNGQCSVTLKCTTAETVQVTTTFAGFSKTANVTFVAGVASNANSTLSATPSSVADDGITTSTLQVTVEDSTGNPVNNQAVTFASGGTDTTLSATTCTTASGVCSVTIKSAVAQTVTITATFAGLTKTANVTFNLGAPASSQSSMTASPNSAVADGNSAITLTVTAKDATGNPISGQAVSFTASGSANTFAPVSGFTNGLGIFTATLTSTTAQSETITAILGAANVSTSVTFTPLVVLHDYSNAAIWSSYVVNDGATTFNASNTPCTGGEPGGYNGCLHGGELLYIPLRAFSGCSGLAASDALGAFNWVCDTSLGYVRIMSTGLASGKNLTNLLDFTNIAWLQNSLTVTNGGVPIVTTNPAAWWTNPIAQVTGVQTLNATGTVYMINGTLDFAAAPTGITINANNVSLAIAPNVSVSDANTVVQASNVNFCWVEGTFTGNANSRIGVAWTNVNESVLRNATFSSFGVNSNANDVLLINSNKNNLTGIALYASAGIYLNTSNYNTLQNSNSYSSNHCAVTQYGTSYNRYLNLNVSNSPDCGLWSQWNTGTYISQYNGQNRASIFVEADTHTILDGIRVFGSIEAISLENDDGVYAHDVTMAATWGQWGMTLFGCKNCVVVDFTCVNESGGGVTNNPVDLEAWNDVLMNGIAANSAPALDIYGSGDNTLINIAATNSTTAIYVDPNTVTNHFRGKLLVGGNPNECFAKGSNGTGLKVAGGGTKGKYGTCIIDPNNSTATLQHGVALDNAFVGRVSTTDPCNTSNVNGEAQYSATMDWFSFSAPYRGWGLDGTSTLSADTQGMCNWSGSPNCRIYDFSLSASDSTVRGILPQPTTGNEVVTHIWTDGSTTTFLVNAYEIYGDGVGNDNWLCESNEACVYTPNIGAYQGHGALVSSGIVGTGGTVTNVTFRAYTTNGY